MNWKSFPKTELHLHLEGAAPVEFIAEQSRKKNIDISHVMDGEFYKWQDFNDFLKTYEAVMSVLITPQDFADLTKAVLRESASQGVKYTEIFLGSILMADNDPVKWKDMLDAIEEATNEMEAECDIVARFIPVIVRHFGVERAEETARLVAKHRTQRLTGFGMAGAEDFERPQDFVKAFAIAGDAGYGLTVHAGEWCDPASIKQSIETLNVTRLGHGVRAIEDASLIDLIKEKDIHLEVCPGSNVSLGASKSWEDHQIHSLRDQGVSISISTDDPPYFATTMESEYAQLNALGWTEDQFQLCNREAMRHAFVDEGTRQKLIQKFK